MFMTIRHLVFKDSESHQHFLVCIFNERPFCTRNGSVIQLREPDSHFGLLYPNSEEKQEKGKKEK